MAGCGSSRSSGPQLAINLVTRLAKGRDAKVVERCTDVHTAATENLPLLAESEIDAKTLKDLKSGIDAFDKLKPGPRDRRVARTTATKSVRTFIAQSRTILNNRIDKYMVKFKQSEPIAKPRSSRGHEAQIEPDQSLLTSAATSFAIASVGAGFLQCLQGGAEDPRAARQVGRCDGVERGEGTGGERSSETCFGREGGMTSGG